MSEQLLPCPFCGGAAEYMEPSLPDVSLVTCPDRKCPINRPLSMNREQWNTRAQLDTTVEAAVTAGNERFNAEHETLERVVNERNDLRASLAEKGEQIARLTSERDIAARLLAVQRTAHAETVKKAVETAVFAALDSARANTGRGER